MVPLLAVGVGLSAISSISGGFSQSANYQAQANAQNYNAQLQKQQAAQALALSGNKVAQQQRNFRTQQGMQRAAQAEAGIGFTGTGLDLMNASAVKSELDKQNILYEGELAAQGLESQAEQSTYAANVASSQVMPSVIGGFIGGGANLLSGVGSYLSYNNQQKLNAKNGVL